MITALAGEVMDYRRNGWLGFDRIKKTLYLLKPGTWRKAEMGKFLGDKLVGLMAIR